MPIVGAMYTKAVELFVVSIMVISNSDTIVSVNLFELLELCRLKQNQGNTNLRVMIGSEIDCLA